MPRRRIAAFIAALCACAHGGRSPPAAFDLLYVSSEGSGDVSFVDTRADEVVATVHVGKGARGLRPSPDGRWLYVALSGSNAGRDRPARTPEQGGDGIAVVDVERRSVARVLKVAAPQGVDVSPDGKLLYASSPPSGTATVVDVAAGRPIATARIGADPGAVATRPDGGAVYVASEGEAKVTVLDPRGKVVATFPTAAGPRDVVFGPDGVLAFVAADEGGAVTVVDVRRNAPLSTLRIDPPGARPVGLAISRDGTRLYVASARAGTVTVVEVATQHAIATYPSGGQHPCGIAVTRDGRKLYVANAESDDVSVLDASTGNLRKRLRVGTRPWGIALAR